MKLSKKRYLIGFTAVVLVLAGVRWRFPQVAEGEKVRRGESERVRKGESEKVSEAHPLTFSPSHPHKILSVPSFKECFPDTQAVQLQAALKYGVKRVKDREDAERRKNELVYVGANPYYHVDRLHSSIPYLVPRAAVLLQDIGEAFFDSLYAKGLPLHQLIVTSVLRSMDDVAKLQRHNPNATEQSCHLYGTTIDICYNRYQPLTREVRNDTLKWVLSEVLRDKRNEGRCYIKYEVKQGCFHMTVR